MSHVNVRFRPKIEEVEPRLVPRGGPWHALSDVRLGFREDYQSETQYLAHFNDPYCNGTAQGPCAAWPELVQLRAELYQLRDDLFFLSVQADIEHTDDQAELQRLKDQRAPASQQIPVEVQIEHDAAVRDKARHLDTRTGNVAGADDEHLQQFADNLLRTFAANMRQDLHYLDEAKKRVDMDYKNRVGWEQVLRDETAEARWEGRVAVDEYAINQFLYRVR